MVNHMAEVAKLLGVELGEVFSFKGCSGCYTNCSKTYLKLLLLLKSDEKEENK